MPAEDVEWSRYVVCICYLWATRLFISPQSTLPRLKKKIYFTCNVLWLVVVVLSICLLLRQVLIILSWN